MKKIYLTSILLFFAFFALTAQSNYEISKDPKHSEVKILKGLINKYLIQGDTSFKWYGINQTLYSPDSSIVHIMEKSKGKVHYILFGGTWCEDTQFILPKFFKLQEMSSVPDSIVTFFGVNREKKSLVGIAEAFDIKNVPTIIVMKNGKELGRVVEYGKTGKWDQELAAILNQ